MAAKLQSVSIDKALVEAYDEIIDVRSPSEFAIDHLPGAINLPSLSDEERIEVGTLYKQVNPFVARKVGAAHMTRNVSEHLSQHFAQKSGTYAPLVYCWRGGQRSNAFASILTQVGWKTSVVDGGYRAFRKHVVSALEGLFQQFNFVILCGLSGVGKTRALVALDEAGQQVVDLEGLAQHRGSVLGGNPNAQNEGQDPAVQPSQKQFETKLFQKLASLDPSRRVWLEAESAKIGRLFIPQALHDKMRHSTSIGLDADMGLRVDHILADYQFLSKNPCLAVDKMRLLSQRYSNAQFDAWQALAEKGDARELVEHLLNQHYDPSYSQSNKKQFQKPIDRISVPDFSNRDETASFVEKLLVVADKSDHCVKQCPDGL